MELLVLLGQLRRNRIETFAYVGFVFLTCIFQHIRLIAFDDAALYLLHFIDVICLHKCDYGLRHTSYYDIAKEQLAHPLVDAIFDRRFVYQASLEVVYMLLLYAISP